AMPRVIELVRPGLDCGSVGLGPGPEDGGEDRVSLLWNGGPDISFVLSASSLALQLDRKDAAAPAGQCQPGAHAPKISDHETQRRADDLEHLLECGRGCGD